METGIVLMLAKDGKGLELSGFLPFDGDEGFTEESEGNAYDVPLKARGNDGELAITRSRDSITKNTPLAYPKDFPADYDTLPLIKDGKSDMYVCSDGKLTTEPYTDLSRRNIKSFVLKVRKQATAKRTYAQTVKDAKLVWPDGQVRNIRFDIKANNPMTPEAFEAQKSQASQKRQQTTAQQIVNRDAHLLVAPLVTKWRAAGKDNETIRTLLESMDFKPETWPADIREQ